MSKDPARLSGKGGILLKEEKLRKRINRDKPKARSFHPRRGQLLKRPWHFTVGGRIAARYISMGTRKQHTIRHQRRAVP